MQKVAALLTAVLALSLVAGLANAYTLGDYPKFCVESTDGGQKVNCYIVTGADAKPEDVNSAIDIALRLAGESYTQVSTAGAGVTTVTGGVDLSTANTKIYYGDAINKEGLKTTLTKDDLSILASGSVVSTAGTEYKYDQYITIGGRTITFDKSSGDLTDPDLYIDTGTSTSSPLYTVKVVFSKDINVESTDVQSNKITLFGKDYTIGSGSLNNKLILYGAGVTKTINEGDSVTVTIEGNTHTITVSMVESSTQAVIDVDGTTREVTEAGTYLMGSPAINIYVDAVYYSSKTGTVGSVKLSLGSAKVILQNGQKVKIGKDETPLTGTLVTITNSTSGISTIEIAETAAKSSEDYIEVGSQFTDRVFGTFSVDFDSITPALDSSARDTITVATSGDTTATLTFTDYRGYEKTIEFAFDSDPATFDPTLSDSNSKSIHVIEGEAISDGEYVLLSQGGFSHLYKLSDMSVAGESTDYVTFEDVFSGESKTITLGSDEKATAYIDGQTYYINATSSAVKITWGTGATYGSVGDEITAFPLLKANNGEYVSFIYNDTYSFGNTTGIKYYLPGDTTAHTITNDTTSVTAGRITYTFKAGATSAKLTKVGGVAVNVPTVLVLEEKGKDASGTEVQDAIIVPVTSETSKMAISTSPTLTAATNSSLITLGSDTHISKRIDRYGTLVTVDNTEQNRVTISYPDNQALMNVYVLGEGGAVTTTTTTGETVNKVVPIETPLAKLDTEISDPATVDKNLIVVGGPAVNRLAAKLMNLTYPHYGSMGGLPFSSGEGYIKVYNDAFGVTGKTAILVAGWSASDTSNACHVLQQYDTFADQLNANTAVKVTSVTAAGITPA